MTSISDALIDASLLDFSKTCRLCLHQGTELSQLFSESENADTSITSLPSKIMACVSIEVSPENNMPKQICTKCLQQVDNWVKFKELCDSANALLQQCLANLQPSSAEDAETLRNNLQGAVSAIPDMLSDMDVSIFERDSLFGTAEEGSQADVWLMPDDFNSSLPDSFLNQKIQINKSSEDLFRKLMMSNSSSGVIKLHSVVDVGENEEEVAGGKEKENKKEEPEGPSKWKEKYDSCYKKSYPCDLCNKTFSKFLHLLNHDQTFHADRLKDFSCTVCGQLFVSQSRVDIHILKHREKSVECDVCHRKFLTRKCLSVHMRLHSETNRFVCEFCGVVKGSSRILDDHIRSMHSKERPFACQICGKKFSTEQGRVKHNRSQHLELKSFKCDVCGCLRNNLSALNYHKQTHNNTKDRMCDFCGKSFKTEITFKDHLKTHSDNKPHKCLVCSASFIKKYLLVRHEATHLDLYPFSCFVCSKSFKRKDFLNVHLRLHSGDKRYSCPQCCTAFMTLKDLKKHKTKCSPTVNNLNTDSSECSKASTSILNCNRSESEGTFLTEKNMNPIFIVVPPEVGGN